MFLCQLCFCSSHIPVPAMFLCQPCYMRLWIICGDGLYAAIGCMRRWIVCSFEVENRRCVGIMIGWYARMLRSISCLPLKLKIEGVWAVDWKICPCVREHELAPTEVENRRFVGSRLKDFPCVREHKLAPTEVEDRKCVWAVDWKICPCGREHELAPTEVEDSTVADAVFQNLICRLDCV